MKSLSYHEIVERIITINHAWKLAREEFGPKNAITMSLREQKSSWQASLLREFPEQVYLHIDEENSTPEDRLFSVRFKTPIQLDTGIRSDAEHLPERIAKKLFWENELVKLIK
jgi:hypothetical protein